MEIVRNIRDTNWLKINAGTGATWLDGLASIGSPSIDCSTTNGCQADYTSASMSVFVSPLDEGYLNIDSNGFYSYSITGTPAKTKFQRKIIIACLNSSGGVDDPCLATDYIIKVTSQVSWDEKANYS